MSKTYKFDFETKATTTVYLTLGIGESTDELDERALKYALNMVRHNEVEYGDWDIVNVTEVNKDDA